MFTRQGHTIIITCASEWAVFRPELEFSVVQPMPQHGGLILDMNYHSLLLPSQTYVSTGM